MTIIGFRLINEHLHFYWNMFVGSIHIWYGWQINCIQNDWGVTKSWSHSGIENFSVSSSAYKMHLFSMCFLIIFSVIDYFRSNFLFVISIILPHSLFSVQCIHIHVYMCLDYKETEYQDMATRLIHSAFLWRFFFLPTYKVVCLLAHWPSNVFVIVFVIVFHFIFDFQFWIIYINILFNIQWWNNIFKWWWTICQN